MWNSKRRQSSHFASQSGIETWGQGGSMFGSLLFGGSAGLLLSVAGTMIWMGLVSHKLIGTDQHITLVLASMIIGILVGAVEGLYQRYQKVVNFRRNFMGNSSNLQQMTDKRLRVLAGYCDDASKAIITLQKHGLGEDSTVEMFDSTYKDLVRRFKEAQEQFYEAYDAVKAVTQIDNWWKIELLERSFKAYLPPTKTTPTLEPEHSTADVLEV